MNTNAPSTASILEPDSDTLLVFEAEPGAETQTGTDGRTERKRARDLAPAPLSATAHRHIEHALSIGPRESRVVLALAAHLFRRHRLWREWGFVTQADYVRERLGQPLPNFHEWSSAGRLFAHLSAARRAFRRGELSFSSASLLGRRCTLDEAADLLPHARTLDHRGLRNLLKAREEEREEVPVRLADPGSDDDAHGDDAPAADTDTATDATDAADTDPDTPAPETTPTLDRQPDARSRPVTLSLEIPRSAVTYLEDTVELARALCGGDLSPADALGAVLAEASTEIEAPPPYPSPVPSQLLPVPGRTQHRPTPSSGPRDPVPPTPADPHEFARRLDARMRAALHDLATWTTRAEDLLLDAFHSDEHLACGFTNFYRYVTEHFEVSRAKAIDMVERARLRRTHHPLALARAQGRIGPIAATILRALERIGVPRSALESWIDLATRITIRLLRRLVAWARRTARRDQRAWAVAGYAPPDLAEVQTSELPLAAIAANPTPPDPATLAAEPTERVRWQLDPADHALLLDLTRALDAEARRWRRPRPATWWSLVRIFHLAREAWRDAARSLPRHPHRAVLERDRFQCQVPGCSRRAVEVHHVHFRSRGGADDPANLLCLCPEHHRHFLHAGRLRIDGRVTEDRRQLRFQLGLDHRGRPLLTYVGEELETHPDPEAVQEPIPC